MEGSHSSVDVIPIRAGVLKDADLWFSLLLSPEFHLRPELKLFSLGIFTSLFYHPFHIHKEMLGPGCCGKAEQLQRCTGMIFFIIIISLLLLFWFAWGGGFVFIFVFIFMLVGGLFCFHFCFYFGFIFIVVFNFYFRFGFYFFFNRFSSNSNVTKSDQTAMAEIPTGTRAIPGPKAGICFCPKLHSLIFSCEDLGQSPSCVVGHSQG